MTPGVPPQAQGGMAELIELLLALSALVDGTMGFHGSFERLVWASLEILFVCFV
jgi:hypothetical protein